MNGMVNQQRNDEGLRELALFAGAGGGILGGHLLGWRTICAVEYNAYARSVLLARQNDGTLPTFPVWDDVCTFDGKPWRGIVDVVSGGFPCQDLSSSGSGAGLEGKRSGLWFEMARIIGEIRPRFVFIENSPNLAHNGLARVLSDLASMGFDAKWGVIGASSAGAPHQRERIWIFANSTGIGQQITRRVVWPFSSEKNAYREADSLVDAFQRKSLPFVCRSHDGVANSMERLTAIGNGQAPYAAATAWELLGGE
jgi:DNA (cytosine-5)-methyltransferase 1